MGSWKDSTRRTLIGPQVKLKATGEECWIRAKKMSIEATDKIGDLQRSLFRNRENREKLRKYQEIEKRLKEEGKTLEDADPLELIEYVPEMEPTYRDQIYRIALADGIGEHNFVDDTGNLIENGKIFDEKTIAEILEWEPLATEIFQAIQGHNRPLARRSGRNSGTSQNGSSGEPSSPTTESRSPTEADPPS
jgi:hypothetical protein